MDVEKRKQWILTGGAALLGALAFGSWSQGETTIALGIVAVGAIAYTGNYLMTHKNEIMDEAEDAINDMNFSGLDSDVIADVVGDVVDAVSDDLEDIAEDIEDAIDEGKDIKSAITDAVEDKIEEIRDETEETISWIHSLKVVELRAELKARGVHVTTKSLKADLQEKLKDVMEEE